VRHKFELIFLEVSAKNKALFFFKSLQEQNITSPPTGVSNAHGSYGSYGSSLGILKFFADVTPHHLQEMKAVNGELRESGLELWTKKEKSRMIRTEALRKSQSQREATWTHNRQSEGRLQYSDSVLGMAQNFQPAEHLYTSDPTLAVKCNEPPVGLIPKVPKRKRGRPLGSKNKPKKVD